MKISGLGGVIVAIILIGFGLYVPVALNTQINLLSHTSGGSGSSLSDIRLRLVACYHYYYPYLLHSIHVGLPVLVIVVIGGIGLQLIITSYRVWHVSALILLRK